MLSDKAYFGLDEIQARFGLSRRDLAYLIENGLLKTSVRVWHVLVEEGYYEHDAQAGHFRVPCDQRHVSGLLDLYTWDAYRLFRDQAALIDSFDAAEGDYCVLLRPEDGIEVRLDDLVVRREERDRFAREHRPPTPRCNGQAFTVVGDYKEVIVNGRSFHLGSCQAKVVRLLHAAAKTKDPWRHGKVVLADAGSLSTRMADLFKSQRHWRELIESDRRGHYRLASPLHPTL